MFFFYVICYLCGLEKDCFLDFLKNIVIKSFVMGYVFEILDIVFDKYMI